MPRILLGTVRYFRGKELWWASRNKKKHSAESGGNAKSARKNMTRMPPTDISKGKDEHTAQARITEQICHAVAKHNMYGRETSEDSSCSTGA
jgi:hypothetical protein